MFKKSQRHNIHSHSNFSDGKHSVFEMVEHAKKIGFTTIGFSDHLCVGGDRNLNENNINAYVMEIERARNHFQDIKILLGAEVDIPTDENHFKILSDIKSYYKFDYYIGAQHFVPMKNFRFGSTVYMPADKKDELFSIVKTVNIWKSFEDPVSSLWVQSKYWDNMFIFATHPMFDVIAHVDYIRWVGGGIQYQRILEKIRDFLSAVYCNRKIIEVNTGRVWWCPTFSPGSDVLNMVLEFDIPVIITSDSHSKQSLANRFESARKHIRKGIHNHYPIYRPYNVRNEFLNKLIFKR